MTEQEQSDRFKEIKDGVQSNLDGVREKRWALQKQAFQDWSKHSLRLAELGFAFAAAIASIFAVSEKDSPLPVVIAILVYLLVGFIGFWKHKWDIESGINESPMMGVDVELHLMRVNNCLNKLILEPNNPTYSNEYKKSSKELLDKFSGSRKAAGQTNVWLDIQHLLFVSATLLVLNPFVPMSEFTYWVTFSMAVSVFVLFTAYSWHKAAIARIKLQPVLDQMNRIEREHTKWQNDNALLKSD